MSNNNSSQDRIDALKKSLENVTDKLIRSYKIIGRLNYQNNSLRNRLRGMNKTIPTLYFLFLSCIVSAQDPIPQKANTIIISDTLNLTQLYNKVNDLLFINGYGILNSNQEQGTITTTEKPFKDGVIKLVILIKDNKIFIRGQFNMNLSISVYGVTEESGWDPVQYYGMRKSPSMSAWNEMNKIAEAFPGNKVYLVN